jgi:hypothetical protein
VPYSCCRTLASSHQLSDDVCCSACCAACVCCFRHAGLQRPHALGVPPVDLRTFSLTLQLAVPFVPLLVVLQVSGASLMQACSGSIFWGSLLSSPSFEFAQTLPLVLLRVVLCRCLLLHPSRACSGHMLLRYFLLSSASLCVYGCMPLVCCRCLLLRSSRACWTLRAAA